MSVMNVTVTQELKNYDVRITSRDGTQQVIVERDRPPQIVEIVRGIRGSTGPAGLDGLVGPMGPPGTGAGADLTYVHQQSVSSSTWTINHGMGKYPGVDVVDSAGTLIYGGEIEHLSLVQLTVSFGASFSGKAYLN